MEAEERAEVGGALGELAAAFTGLVEVLLDGGQAQLTPTRIVEVAAGQLEHLGREHVSDLGADGDRPPEVIALVEVLPLLEIADRDTPPRSGRGCAVSTRGH